MSETKAIKAILLICAAITEAIQEIGDQGLPAGTLYATLMATGCSLEQFNQLVDLLVGAGKIRKKGNLLLPA